MQKVKLYIEDSYKELVHKVTWPSWKDLQDSSLVVAVASIIIALLIFVMDFTVGITGNDDSVWRGLLGFIYNIFGNDTGDV